MGNGLTAAGSMLALTALLLAMPAEGEAIAQGPRLASALASEGVETQAIISIDEQLEREPDDASMVESGAAAWAAQASDAAERYSREVFVWDGSERIVRSVELRLAPGIDPEGLSSLVHLRVGQRLERRDLRRTVRRLYQTGLFRQVRAHVKEARGEVHITIVLLPRQKVAEISFLGAQAVDMSRLHRAAGIRRGDDPSPRALAKVAEGVSGAYARIGYLDALVETEVREAEDGQVAILVRIDEGPRSLVAKTRWEGDVGLDEELLNGVLGVMPGDPVDLEKIEEGLDSVRRVFRTHGFLRARVGMPRIEPLEPEALAAEATAPGEPVSPSDAAGRRARVSPAAPDWAPRAEVVVPVSAGPLVRVVVSGNRRLNEAEIRGLIESEGEGMMDADSLSQGANRVEKAYRLAGYHHVKVEIEERALGPRLHELVVGVDEGPPMRVRSITFPGARSISEAWMREQVCLSLESIVPPKGGAVDRLVVSTLGGRGDYQRSSEMRPAGVVPPSPCEVFAREAYSTASEIILDRYRRQGWLFAGLGEPVLSISPDRRVAHVVIEVVEGVRTYLESLSFEGVETLEEGALRSAAGLRVGEPLSPVAVEDGRLALRSLFASRGHPFTVVEPEIVFDEERTRASVRYRIVEGPRVSVGRIIVRGHYHTPAALVRSQLLFRSGDLWDFDRVQASQRRILSLGIYRAASIRLLDPDEPAAVMDVVVNVSERRPKAMEMGMGLSTEDGPRLRAEYLDHAFFWSSELHASAKINYPIFPAGVELRRVLAPGLEWEAQAGLRFPTLLAARTDLVGERANRPTFGLTRAAWSVGADTRWYEDLSASMGVEMEYVDFERAAPDPDLFHPDRELRRFEEGQTLLASLKPTVVLDLRDRRLSPRSGVLASAALDWSHDLGIGVPVHFLKATAAVSGYVPASKRLTVALSARGGWVMPLSEDNVTIEPKRFFLGGADTLRGFPLDGVIPSDQRASLHRQVNACQGLLTGVICTEDALLVLRDGMRPASAGGEVFVLFKGELRFPIAGGLQGGIFVDAGNLWRESAFFDLFDMRTTAGGGLRYETPIGPVAVDLGVNLIPDQLLHEMPMAVHFAIGLF